MKTAAPALSRRQVWVALAAGLIIAPAARAAAPRFPMRLGYLRAGPDGFEHVGSPEQAIWRQFEARMAGLIDEVEPIQPDGLIASPDAPDVDGGPACILAARKLAAEKGFDHLILYSMLDGKRSYDPGHNWLTRTFATLRSDMGAHDRPNGEAYLLGIAGGPPIASATADVHQKELLNPFDLERNPAHETLTALTGDLERQLQRMAASQLAADASIASR